MKKFDFQEIDFEKYETLEKGFKQVNFIQSAAMAKLFQSRSYELYYFEGLRNQKTEMIAFMTSVSIFAGKKFELRFAPSFISGKFDEEVFLEFLGFLKDFVKSRSGLILKVIPDLNYQTYSDEGKALEEANQSFSLKMSQLSFRKTSPEIGYDEGEPTWHYVKDLTEFKDQKALLKSYSKDGQYSVKRTQQFAIEVRKLSYEELSDFKKITEATSERRGYNDHELAYYQAFYKNFGNQAQFLVAEINFQTYTETLNQQIEKLQAQIAGSQSAKKQKQRDEWQSQISSQEKRLREVEPFLEKYQDQSVILAGSLFVETKDEMVYLFSGSYGEFKNFYAPFAIQHFILSECIDKNIPLYNFYGITGNFDGSDGVLHFKQNFRGYAVKKVGSFSYYPKVLRYKLIQIIKKMLHRY